MMVACLCKKVFMTRNQVVCFGEMLWDVLPSGAKPGGAPMNVAYHLQKLGMAPAVISRVGEDERGSELLRLLDENGITTNHVQKDATHPTGVVLARLNERAEASYEIVQPVAWDFIANHDDLKKLIAAARYFVFGSLAAREAVSRHTLFQLLESAGTKVFDINLRTPHYTKVTLELLLQQCDILKINEEELQVVASWYGHLKKLEEQMALLQDRFRIDTVVTTRGSAGAVLLTGGSTHAHAGYKVAVKDTVGSGDAFLAALLSQLQSGAEATEALRFANGLGAYIASKEGACPPYDINDVRDRIKAGFQ
jgi:fructokinase